MMKNLFASAFLFMLTLTVVAQSKEEKKLIIETILSNGNKLEVFFEEGKADSIAGMFSPNSHLIVENHKIQEKREEIENHFIKLFKSGIDYSDFEFEAEEHKVYDDLVLEIGENIVKYTQGRDSKPISKKYNYMLVWKKSKGGKYQIRAATWSSIEDPCK